MAAGPKRDARKWRATRRTAGQKKALNRLAIMRISGIITTILGKSATNSKVAGRERRVHHSKSLPLPFIGEGLFFAWPVYSETQQGLENIGLANCIGANSTPPGPGVRALHRCSGSGLEKVAG
jgi:hypothetical protein